MTLAIRTRSRAPSALRDIQSPIRARLERVVDVMRRVVLADAPLVTRVAAHLMGMKGKMLRPTLVLFASDVDGRSDERAASFAAVVELVHLATLVHDDAVDHSALRRGQPTVNSAFSHQISVIAGDFIYARALTELVALGDIEAIDILTRASAEMSVGELRQLGSTAPLDFSEDEYSVLIRSKTASLMAAACEIGALSGAPRHRRALSDFGNALGMAFQIVDDLIDFTEDTATTGKPAGTDLREGKVTLPLIAALRVMSPAERREVDRLFGGAADDDQIARVAAVVRDRGGLDYARSCAAVYAERAEEMAAGLPAGPASAALARIVGYVMERHA